VEALRPGASTSVPGLALAGSWTATGWPATLEGAVLSGHMAAERTLRTLGIEPAEREGSGEPAMVAAGLAGAPAP
jgi:uncharacterized protein with NAD-binding domain and iron-sulfur cluster